MTSASGPLVSVGGCPEIQAVLAGRAADVVCFNSADLTTNNASAPPNGPTTPADNSLRGLPPGAFTPQTDRAVLTHVPTPLTKAVPGLQVEARFADDAAAQARFVLRFPKTWNGRLVVAGASGTRSEFNGDIAFSDYVVQHGYAYASQNKGVLNFQATTASDPVGCRLNPDSTTFIRFFANDSDKPFTVWTGYMIAAARLARDSARATYGRHPRRTYAVGASNGGYQVRRAIEEAPDLFDGGLDWEGTHAGPNLLVDLPLMLKQFPLYVASGFNAASGAAQAIMKGGYPPDIVSGDLSFWRIHYQTFYEVTMCQWQKRFDPGYDTYVTGLANYDYAARVVTSDVEDRLALVEPTGKIKRPLVTVAGTMDALLPAERHARTYARKVAAARHDSGNRYAQYRLWEVQNGNHIDMFTASFPQLQRIMPHAQRAFDLLVEHVETGAPLPPNQCVPKGGAISATPSRPGLCQQLLID